VTVERVESVGEVDCITIKTEQHCIQLVRTVKSEQEVSGLCCVAVIYLQVCLHLCCTVRCTWLTHSFRTTRLSN
jgi:hypothetical protein